MATLGGFARVDRSSQRRETVGRALRRVLSGPSGGFIASARENPVNAWMGRCDAELGPRGAAVRIEPREVSLPPLRPSRLAP